MFKCQKCNKVSAPRENSNKLVVEKRPMVYEIKDNHNNIIKETKGWEIAKELTVCNECYEKNS